MQDDNLIGLPAPFEPVSVILCVIYIILYNLIRNIGYLLMTPIWNVLFWIKKNNNPTTFQIFITLVAR